MDNNFNFNRITLDILTSAEEIPSPVEISDAYFETNEDTGSIIKITVRRDLSIPIESVTVAFCIDPVNFPEGKRRRVNEVVCNNAALNTREFLTISIKITGNIRINGGCVFLTAVAYDSDMAIKFTPCGLERYVIGDVYDTIPSAIGNSSASSDPVDDLDSYAPPEDIIKPKKNRIKRTVIAVTSSVLIVSSAIVGGLLIWRGQGVEKIADELIAENRYNEAYKIVSDTIYSGVLQKVCEEASVYYASQGDYCTAYVYSKAAPSSYDFYVTEVAKEELLSSVSGNTINQNALAVIRQITDTEKYDSVIASLAEMCRSNRKYDTAMSFAGEISSVEKRNNMTAEIFTDGIKYYTENGQFELIGGLIEAFGYHEDVAGKLTEYCSSIGISINSLIDDCQKNGGSAAAIILSDYLGNNYSDVKVLPDDFSVRRNLFTVYPLLTAEQKRAYHAQPFDYYKEPFLIKDGAIAETFITNAVSVDTGEFQTVVLNSMGNVIPIERDGHNLVVQIPEQFNTVQVAVGQKHVVLLVDNGTVKAYGNNDFGQCDTSEWTDIIAVTAGANFTLGLRSDGSLVACGSNNSGQCNISSYRGVVDIDALDQTAVILFADGSVAVQGDISMGIRDAASFTNIRRISAGDACIVAETTDGKFVMAGGAPQGSCGSVDSWEDIEYFAAGSLSAAYVDKYGSVRYTGDGAPTY